MGQIDTVRDFWQFKQLCDERFGLIRRSKETSRLSSDTNTGTETKEPIMPLHVAVPDPDPSPRVGAPRRQDRSGLARQGPLVVRRDRGPASAAGRAVLPVKAAPGRSRGGGAGRQIFAGKKCIATGAFKDLRTLLITTNFWRENPENLLTCRIFFKRKTSAS